MRARWKKIAFLFAAVLLPLWLFERLADEIREKEGFFFDLPILNAIHRHATPVWDVAALGASHVGLYGTLVADAALVILLFARGKHRSATYLLSSVAGAAALNFIVKRTFARVRPALWPSLAPEKTFSFPSGHAMASMALAAALVALTWRTRAAIPVLCGAILFVLAVGMSRLYLGVHFPSDILAAWAASLSWVAGLALVLRPGSVLRPRLGAFL